MPLNKETKPNHMIILLGMNTRYYRTVCKLFVLDQNT